MSISNNRVGKLYRPSNGTEGVAFQETFCDNCRYESEENPCAILTSTLIHDIYDSDYPKQWTYDEKGHPTCTAFAAHYELPADLRHRGACDDPNQMQLFE